MYVRHLGTRLLAPLVVAAACRNEAQDQTGQAPSPPSVEVLEVVLRPVPVGHEYVGQTMGSREVDIHARVTGIVEQRLYEEGAVVDAGDPLFRIDPQPIALSRRDPGDDGYRFPQPILRSDPRDAQDGSGRRP